MNYQIGEIIPISIVVLTNSGNPQTGKTLHAVVYDADTGQLYVDHATMTEVVSGFYRYSWSPGFTSKKTVLILIHEASGGNESILDSYRVRVGQEVSDLTNTVDAGDGRIS